MKKYLYSINNIDLTNELCQLEMKTIFGYYNSFIISEFDIASDKSVFIKEKMSIYNTATSFEELIEEIIKTNEFFETFKLTYMKNKNDNMSYDDYIECIKKVADIVNGEGEFKTPMYNLAIACIENNWYFGAYEKNSYSWKINNDKPYSYSNAMSADLSRSIINLAMGQNKQTAIIDPCCGVGTVVIDGLMQGANICGTEINPQIGEKAQKNLGYFDLPQAIEIKDMHDIEKYYDVSILDIPYGIMSHTDTELQQNLISQCFNISDKLILVASDDLSEMVEEADFNIEQKVVIRKHNNAKFNRFITICIKNKKK